MSQRHSTTVTCPKCRHTQEFPIWSSLNVSLDPEDGGQEIRVPLTTYRAYETPFGKLVAADTASDDMWQRVDMHYATDFIARQRPTPEP